MKPKKQLREKDSRERKKQRNNLLSWSELDKKRRD